MASDSVKDKQRARLKEKKKAVAADDRKVTKSAIARNAERQKKERAAQIKAAPKNAPAQKERGGGIREYFRGVVVETKKVVWPTRKELVSYTLVVLFACAFFGLFLWGVDSGFLAIIREVFNISMN